MKAAQFFAARGIRVVDIAPPTPQEDEALIAVEWCGICGSDLHEYLYGQVFKPSHTLAHTTQDLLPFQPKKPPMHYQANTSP